MKLFRGVCGRGPFKTGFHCENLLRVVPDPRHPQIGFIVSVCPELVFPKPFEQCEVGDPPKEVSIAETSFGGSPTPVTVKQLGAVPRSVWAVKVSEPFPLAPYRS